MDLQNQIRLLPVSFLKESINECVSRTQEILHKENFSNDLFHTLMTRNVLKQI